MREFEKISFKQFCKDVKKDRELYNKYKTPERDSISSAGYDIALLEDIELKPNETIKIPTGIKAYFENDEVLILVVRSSMGFKFNVRLVNQIGIVDADYYNNKDNEGHIFIKITNDSNENKTVELNAGQGFAQGIFMPFGLVEDDDTTDQRNGGFGSTNK